MLYINDQLQNLDLSAALHTISKQRREQALRFKYEHGRRLSVAAYLLLKHALLEEEGIAENPVFIYSEHGKPSIEGHPELYFSLSHCKEAVACVLSRRPVGVDIESLGRYRESVARYSMNDDELLCIHQSDRPDVAFTRLWTMKESLLKLQGSGITNQIKDVLREVSSSWFSTVEQLDKNYIYTVCEQLE